MHIKFKIVWNSSGQVSSVKAMANEELFCRLIISNQPLMILPFIIGLLPVCLLIWSLPDFFYARNWIA